jgi:hypothetical protein
MAVSISSTIAQSFIDVEVVAGERAAQHPVSVVVMFDEACFGNP